MPDLYYSARAWHQCVLVPDGTKSKTRTFEKKNFFVNFFLAQRLVHLNKYNKNINFVTDLDSDDSDTQVSQATKTGSVSSEKLLRELKFKQDLQYFAECQAECLKVSTCIGVNIEFNEEDYDCTMIDLSDIKSMSTNLASNSTSIPLTHPRRDSIVYGFATQLIAR